MPEVFTEDSWISETIGIKCYRCDAQTGFPLAELAEAMRLLAAGGDAFFYAKVPTDQLPLVSQLMRGGFSLVDTNIVLERQAERLSQNSSDIEVTEARPEHYPMLQDIAESCFRYSRFHQDPRFPVTIANRIKRKWIENYCLGKRGAALYVALLRGNPVGFLAVLKLPGKPSAAAIDLIGVRTEFQQQGIGRVLIGHFIECWQGRVDRLVVGTQITNQSSLALYTNHGFQVMKSAYVLHAHVNNGILAQ